MLVFFDEYWSILLRTLHSIYNRTPHDLLHEIILINDNSTLPELYEPLETYVTKNFNGIVTIHTMKNHIGLAAARFQGAKIARGEVIVSLLTSLISDDYKSFHSKVFLDAQVEVNVNWLPPLLGKSQLYENKLKGKLLKLFQNQSLLIQSLSLIQSSM